MDSHQETDSIEYHVDRYVSDEENACLLKRWLATWFDYVILALFLIIPYCLLGHDLYKETIFIWLAVIVLYFPLAEGFTGFTVGKFVFGIRVIDRKGNVPGLGKAIVRTLTRIIEVNPFSIPGILAGLIAFFSKKSQRLGDMLANTYVISNADLKKMKMDIIAK